MKKDQITYSRLKLTYSKLGYKFFTAPYDMNVFGVRSDCKVAGSFDDSVGIAYVDSEGSEKIFLFNATTDSGSKYLLNPLHPKGAAIMLSGQYPQAYKLGIHGRTWASGGYKALEQINKMSYVRDNNKNNILGDSVSPVFHDVLKTNIHRASKWQILDRIGSYSAGCQVIQSPTEFEIFITICEQQDQRGLGDKFTYTLLEEKDFA